MNDWHIYTLHHVDGTLFYVGFTRNPKRRLKEHRSTYGTDISLRIVQSGSGDENSWSKPEREWIQRCKDVGHTIKNKSLGGAGCEMHSPETRERLAALFRGRAVTWGAKIAAASKGKPRGWSADGEKRVAKTQFKTGQVRDPVVEAKRKQAQRESMKAIAPKDRSKRSTDANRAWWQNATPEERAQRNARMVAGRDPSRRSLIASKNAAAGYVNHPELRRAVSNRITNWWASMTPEVKAEYIARRTEKIIAAKAAKRAANSETAI